MFNFDSVTIISFIGLFIAVAITIGITGWMTYKVYKSEDKDDI